MSTPDRALDERHRNSLRRLRWGVLAGLLLCAGAVATLPSAASSAARGAAPYALAAVGLAIASSLLHQRALRPGRGPAAHLQLLRAATLCGGGIGLVGVVAYYRSGDATIGYGFSVAAAIFALRPGLPLRTRRRP